MLRNINFFGNTMFKTYLLVVMMTFSVKVICWNPFAVKDNTQVCTTFLENRDTFMRLYESREERINNIKSKIAKLLPLLREYSTNKAAYPIDKVNEMTKSHSTNIHFNDYPIYQKDPFRKLGSDFLKDAGQRSSAIQRSANCYLKLGQYEELIMSLNKNYEDNEELKRKIDGTYDMYKTTGSFRKCSVFSPDFIKLYNDVVKDFIDRENRIDVQKQKLLNQAFCENYKFNEFIGAYNAKIHSNKIFYSRILTDMVPHLNEKKQYLGQINTNMDKYIKMSSAHEGYKTDLGKLNFGAATTRKHAADASELLSKAETLYDNDASYLSRTLSSELNNKINQIKQYLTAFRNAKSSVGKYENEVNGVMKKIADYVDFVPLENAQMKEYMGTLRFYRLSIEAMPYADNEEQKAHLRMELDKKISEFLQHISATVLNFVTPKSSEIHKLSTDIKNDVNALKAKYTQLKQETTTADGEFKQLKKSLESLINNDIANHLRKLKEAKIDEQFITDGILEKLNQIETKRTALASDFESIKQNNFEDSQTELNDKIQEVGSTISSITTKNDQLNQLLTNEQSSSLIKNSNKLETFFSTMISHFKQEHDDISKKATTTGGKIDNFDANVKANENALHEMSEFDSKIRNDWAEVDKAKKKLLKHFHLPHGQFLELVQSEAGNLNLNLTGDLSKIGLDSEKCEKDIFTVSDEKETILGEINSIDKKLKSFETKLYNLQRLHSNVLEAALKLSQHIKPLDLDSIETIKQGIDAKLTEHRKLIDEKKQNKNGEQQSYDSSLNEAEKLIAEINQISQNQKIKEYLNEYSPDKKLDALKKSIKELDDALTTAEIETGATVTKNTEETKKLEQHKIAHQKTLDEINNLLENYNGRDSSMFSDESSINRLIAINSNIKEKCDQINPIDDLVNNKQNDFRGISTELQRHAFHFVTTIEKVSQKINEKKVNAKEYIRKLELLKTVATSINTANESLESKKQQINALKSKLETHHTASTEKITNNQGELDNTSKQQKQVLENKKEEMLELLKKYTKLYEDTKSKYDEKKIDLPTGTKDKYKEISSLKSKIEEVIKKQVDIVDGDFLKVVSHYKSETLKLENEYSYINSLSDDFLKGISDFTTSFESIEFDDNTNENLNNQLNSILSDIDGFLKNSNEGYPVIMYSGSISTEIPADLNTFKTDIDAASAECQKLIEANIEQAEQSEQSEQKIVEEPTKIESPTLSEERIANSSNYEAVEGDSQNIATTDHFKTIVAVAAVAAIALIIGAAVLKYRSMKKKEIYNKCEDVYMKA